MSTILNTCTRPTDYSRAKFLEGGGSQGIHESVFKAAAQVELLKYLLKEGCPAKLALEILAETDNSNFVVHSRYEYEKQRTQFAETLRRATEVETNLRSYIGKVHDEVVEITAAIERLFGEMQHSQRTPNDRRKHKRKINQATLALHRKAKLLMSWKAPTWTLVAAPEGQRA